VEGEEYLKDAGRVALVPSEAPFEDCFLSAMDRQVRHVRSLSLWPLRGAGWFYLRKRARHNIPLARMHEKGMVRMPHEIVEMQVLKPEAV
jgi:hypothetical protein